MTGVLSCLLGVVLLLQLMNVSIPIIELFSKRKWRSFIIESERQATVNNSELKDPSFIVLKKLGPEDELKSIHRNKETISIIPFVPILAFNGVRMLSSSFVYIGLVSSLEIFGFSRIQYSGIIHSVVDFSVNQFCAKLMKTKVALEELERLGVIAMIIGSSLTFFTHNAEEGILFYLNQLLILGVLVPGAQVCYNAVAEMQAQSIPREVMGTGQAIVYTFTKLGGSLTPSLIGLCKLYLLPPMTPLLPLTIPIAGLMYYRYWDLARNTKVKDQ